MNKFKAILMIGVLAGLAGLAGARDMEKGGYKVLQSVSLPGDGDMIS